MRYSFPNVVPWVSLVAADVRQGIAANAPASMVPIMFVARMTAFLVVTRLQAVSNP